MTKYKNSLLIASSAIWLIGCVSVPSHSIVAWYSTSGPIPNGWVVCDGKNGTPDLTDRFIRGVDDTAKVGQSAGSENQQFTFHGVTDKFNGISNVHVVQNGNASLTVPGVDHTHNFSGTTDLLQFCHPTLPWSS
jgi:hypothetical protein